MAVLDHSKPFYKIEFYDSGSTNLKSVFSPNVYLDTEKPSDDDMTSTDVYASHIIVNSNLNGSVNTSEIEVRHGVGGELPIEADDKVKIYFGFYDQDASLGPEFSLVFTGIVTKIKNGLEKSIISCESIMKEIASKKTKITFSRAMGIDEIIEIFAIELGGQELSQTGIHTPGITKQPGYGIEGKIPLLDHIKELAKYSAMDVFTDVFDKFYTTPWDKSSLTEPSSNDTPWISARGKNESENSDFYKHTIIFDQNLLDLSFDVTGDKYLGVEVVAFIPFSEEQVPTIDTVKVEYTSLDVDSEKPLNRFKIPHILREDAEKIAENLFKSEASRVYGSMKLLSAPQIRAGDGIVFDGESIEDTPFENIEFHSEEGGNSITDIVFQVSGVQHKFDTVEGFITNVKLIDLPASAGTTEGAEEAPEEEEEETTEEEEEAEEEEEEGEGIKFEVIAPVDKEDPSAQSNKVSLMSEDGQYIQTLTIGDDGVKVMEGYTKLTFVNVPTGKTYNVEVDTGEMKYFLIKGKKVD